MFETPIHILKKLVKEYTAGRVNIKLTEDKSKAVTKDLFEVSLPTFDILGEPTGTHNFAITVESLVSTKIRVLAEMDAYISRVDEFMETYDSLIAVLQDAKNKKTK